MSIRVCLHVSEIERQREKEGFSSTEGFPILSVWNHDEALCSEGLNSHMLAAWINSSQKRIYFIMGFI